MAGEALIAAILLALGIGAARETRAATGDSPAAQAQTQDEAIAEEIALFDELCLRAFPNDKAIDAAAASKGMPVMSAADVQKFLHLDPGRGWYYKADGSSFLYAITIEAPPYHACAVRRIYGSAPPFQSLYQSTLARWVAADGHTQLGKGVERSGEREGQSIHAVQQPVARDGKLAEMLMTLDSRFPNGNVEVRFVRQIPTAR